MFLCYVGTIAFRLQYYFSWIICEGACNIAGLGYTKDGASRDLKWMGLTNINVFNVETATNIKACTSNWNILTQSWLMYICYNREKTLQVFKTMFLAALWHGFYPGYYSAYAITFMMVGIGRQFRRSVRPFFQTSKALIITYDILTFAVTQALVCYVIVQFSLGVDLQRCIKGASAFYFSGHLALIAAFAVLPFLNRSGLS